MKLEARSIFSSSQTSNISIIDNRHPQTPETKASNKFHRAAIDGYVDMLCEASRRDTNRREDTGLTPTLLAASSGHLDALRILVGRGGDPEKTTPEGFNALHLATMKNHLNCVSFLVNFGVNMWALNNELHTAKDIAAMEQRKEILDYLDQVMARQSALNTKQVQKLKEKAKVGAEKRLKQMRKAQLKAIKQVEKDERFLVRLSNNRRLLKAAHSISDIKLVRPADSMINLAFQTNNKSKLILSSNNSASVSNLVASSSDWKSQKEVSKLKTPPSCVSSDDSAYLSSSVSSNSRSQNLSSSSSVVSSISTSPSTTNSPKNKQPKFSELTKIAISSSTQTKNIKAKKHSVKSSVSSSSESTASIGAKLRVMASGGVSRKVQLKRMLINNKSLTTNKQQLEVSNELEHDTSASNDLTDDLQSARLCNVQPAIKLKLLNQTDANNNNINQSIKWPPAPSLSMVRTVSEPDFVANIIKRDDKDQEEKTRGDLMTHVENNDDERDKSQRHRLTQCLSQLRLHHQERSASKNVTSGSTQVLTKPPPPIPPSATNSSNAPLPPLINKPPSDELIQHQLNVGGEFGSPLKPSQIKHQLRQQNQPLVQQKKLTLTNKSNNLKPTDSIGSASSLAQRNFLQSQSSDNSTGSSSPPLTYIQCRAEDDEVEVEVELEEIQKPDLGKHDSELHQISCEHEEETLETFLIMNGLIDLLEVFEKEKIDLEALVLLSEEDLKSLNILLGPRRKLSRAIENRHRQQAITRPMYVMVDTPL